jgi:hypothetical protein
MARRHWCGTCGPKFTFHIHVKPSKEEPYGTTLFARRLQGCARGHAQAQKRYAEERQKPQDRQEPQAGHRYRPRRGAQERQESAKTSIGAVVMLAASARSVAGLAPWRARRAPFIIPGTRAAPLRCGRQVRAEGQSWALARPSIAPAARAGRWARLGRRCLVAAGADGAEWPPYR